MSRFPARALLMATVLAVAVLFAPPLLAQRVYIDINSPGFEQVPIAVPGFKQIGGERPELAAELAEMLSRDLRFSGVFRTLDPRGFLVDPQTMGVTLAEIDPASWRRLGAEYLARGAFEVHGNSLKLELRLFDLYSAERKAGKIYEGAIDDRRAMIHRFADEILFALTGERGVFETKIAFIQSTGKTKDLYVIDFDGENPIRVTADNTTTLSPAWSSSGNQIAYVSYKDGFPRVYIHDLLNGGRRPLMNETNMNISPAWRPNGMDLAVTISHNGNSGIYLVDRTGSSQKTLIDTWAIEVSPAWSPDGRSLAFVSNENGNPHIYVLNVDSGEKRRITFEGKYNTSPAWSPKGDRIAFSGLVEGHHQIFTIRPNGEDLRQITFGESSNESPSWSPDGRMIAFSSDRKGGVAIWVMLANGGGVRKLTEMGGEQILPDWSPRRRGVN